MAFRQNDSEAYDDEAEENDHFSLLDEAFKYCNIAAWGDVSRLHSHGPAIMQYLQLCSEM